MLSAACLHSISGALDGWNQIPQKLQATQGVKPGQDVIERVEFHNTGPSQIPGLIVMSLRGEENVEIVVMFNASTEEQTFYLDFGEDCEFELHEVLEESHDRRVRRSGYDEDDRTFRVPARTTAVFVADD